MSAALGEIGPEAVTTDVFHFMFVWEGRDGAGGILPVEGFVDEDKISEAAADAESGFLKGFKIRLGGAR